MPLTTQTQKKVKTTSYNKTLNDSMYVTTLMLSRRHVMWTIDSISQTFDEDL